MVFRPVLSFQHETGTCGEEDDCNTLGAFFSKSFDQFPEISSVRNSTDNQAELDHFTIKYLSEESFESTFD